MLLKQLEHLLIEVSFVAVSSSDEDELDLVTLSASAIGQKIASWSLPTAAVSNNYITGGTITMESNVPSGFGVLVIKLCEYLCFLPIILHGGLYFEAIEGTTKRSAAYMHGILQEDTMIVVVI